MKNIFLILYFLCFFSFSSFINTQKVFAEESTPTTQEDAWDILLQSSSAELEKVNAQIEELKTSMPIIVKTLQENTKRFKNEYEKLAAMLQVSRGRPIEITVIEERARRLIDAINATIVPQSALMRKTQEYFDSFNSIAQDAEQSKSVALQQYKNTLDSMRTRYASQVKILTREINALEAIKKQATDFINKLIESKPNLWWTYYFSNSTKIFDIMAWQDFINNPNVFSSMKETLALRLSIDIPQDTIGWLSILVRLLTVFIPLYALVYFSFKFMNNVSPPLLRGWKRLTQKSFAFMLFGLSLHYVALTATHGYFQAIGAIGTVFFIWGQFCFASDLGHFFEEEPQRLNPLWPMFPQVIAGLILLYLDMQGIMLIFTWLAVLAIASYFAWKRYVKAKEPNSKTANRKSYLIFYLMVLFLACFLTLLGWCRLSILICMISVALCITIQQGLAIFSFANKINAFLPKEGMKAILGALVIALGIPLMLALVIVSLFFWFLAYPGSTHLVENVMLMDLKIGEYSFNFAQVILIIAAIYLTRSLIGVGRSFLSQMRLQGFRISPSLVGPMQTTYTYALWAICGLYILSALGFNLTSLTVIAGGLSVGLGFGLQNIVQNFMSGLMVIFGQTIREGDIVDVGTFTGTIRKVNIRSTMLETFDNAIVFIPNSSFLSTSFVNWTHNGSRVRREITVGVAYGTDLNFAIKLLLDIAKNHHSVLDYPEPLVFFTDFADSSLTLLFRFWISDINYGMGILSSLRLEIDKVFKENNIEIAFPQVDVHVKENNQNKLPPSTENEIEHKDTEQKEPI